MINTILFDLDGTLLPMDQDKFLNAYFTIIGKKFQEYDLDKLMKALKYGIMGMIANDGKVNNETKFWEIFYQLHPRDSQIESRFLELYENEFQSLVNYTNPNPLSSEVIKILKDKGYQIACCTNPLFPALATHSRLRWAGLDPNDFIHVTTFENSSYSKPNLDYYREVLQKINKNPEECLMVGNDVLEDLVVNNINMTTFLIEDCLINNNTDIVTKYRGRFPDFVKFVQGLPERNKNEKLSIH
jgi:FMN phosphatase YigB (HAD superfamily)